MICLLAKLLELESRGSFFAWQRDRANKTCKDKIRSLCIRPICPITSSQKSEARRSQHRRTKEAVLEPMQTKHGWWGTVNNLCIQANLGIVIHTSVCIMLPSISSCSCVIKIFSTAQACPSSLSLLDNREETDVTALLGAKVDDTGTRWRLAWVLGMNFNSYRAGTKAEAAYTVTFKAKVLTYR